MRVLIACEYSGVVRDAFGRRGHFALSCDLLPTEVEGNHYQGDVFDVIDDGWDLMIAHPPCTYLAVSSAPWFYHPDDAHLPCDSRRPHPKYPNRRQQQSEALNFVQRLMDAPIPHIALENPVSVISSKIRKPDQIVQPWQFGHGETKATCLWLKNLPNLKPTNVVDGREQRVHRMSPGPNRWKERSRTFTGIAEAMASQWSQLTVQTKLL